MSGDSETVDLSGADPAQPPGTTEPVSGLERDDTGRFDTPEEGETFPRAYVEQLRREAAEHRTRAAAADELRERLLVATIREAAGTVLEDPETVRHGRGVAEFMDDDGFPSVERIRTIAENLAATKPYLARRRATGDVDQGARLPVEETSLTSLLRERAG